MSHFYERVLNGNINYFDEVNKIVKIFETEKVHTSAYYDRVSIAAYIDSEFFRNLDLSSNYLSLFDILEEIKHQSPVNAFVEYSELILSLAAQLISKEYYSENDKSVITEKLANIIKIIDFDLDKLNLKYEFIENNAGKVAIIIPKDELLESTLEVINDGNISRKLIEYKSIKMDGNINGKEALLLSFSKYIEPLLKNKELKQMNPRLFDDVSFMLNNLDLRHNNINANERKYYQTTLKKREEWLDKLFIEILLVIKSEIERKIHKEISDIKDD